MSHLQINSIPGSNGIGCEVRGLVFDDLDKPDIRKELFDAWIEHGLVVFRGVKGDDFQVKLSSVFGDPQPHPHDRNNQDRKYKEIVEISYKPGEGDVVEVDGQELGGWLPWHMDLIYLDKVSRGSILRPVKMPSRGGDTGFIDKIKLYEKLDPELKRKIENLSVIYHFDIDVGNMRFGRQKSVKVVGRSKLYEDILARRDQFPRTEHPLVYRQKETGRPVLNFSPWFAQEIPGIPREESDRILTALGDLCLQPENSYYHPWREDDMVLWDNWRMLHSASGVPKDELRIMERTQLMGDYGLGRLESNRAAVGDEMRIVV